MKIEFNNKNHTHLKKTHKTLTRTNIPTQPDRNVARCRLFYLFLFMTLRHLRSLRTVFIFMHI